MDPISKLAELFEQFPGIGKRQSKRFVYYLLKRERSYVNELARQIQALDGSVSRCDRCHRYYTKKHEEMLICPICSDTTRDHTMLMIVEKDSDLEALERSGTFKGLYFVLGGTLPILEREPEKKIRIHELRERLMNESENFEEIILACAVTPESEHTAEYVEQVIRDVIGENAIKITYLGRGLSTGTELEYSDKDTLRYALEGRK